LAGRPKRRARQLAEVLQAAPTAVPTFKGDSLDLLRQAYRDESLPMPMRLTAAQVASSFEHGKKQPAPPEVQRSLESLLVEAGEKRAARLAGGGRVVGLATMDDPELRRLERLRQGALEQLKAGKEGAQELVDDIDRQAAEVTIARARQILPTVRDPAERAEIGRLLAELGE
jgi:hypothetical protein